jgi:FKBP-type peptidyl-prolyl cis-trans isomerase FkpA
MRFKNLLLLATVLFIFTACNKDKTKYEKHASGLEYIIVEKGKSDVKLKNGDVISVLMTYETEDGKVLFNSYQTNRKYLRTVSKPSHKGGSFEDGLMLLGVGDSAIFRINAESFLRYSELQSKISADIKPEDFIIVKLRVLELVEKDNFDDILSDKYHTDETVEMELLNNYLKNANINVKPTESGLYYVEKVKGKGRQAQKGNQVSVHYTLTLIDGQLIETSLDKKPISYRLGEGKVIDGWEEGIAYMREGGKATLIVPSKIGYGKEGKGSIMPNSTLIFEVELVKVN